MQENQPPPQGLKPWYYRNSYLFPAILFWPLWSVLIIRSPWHNGVLSGGVAWALLVVGGFLTVNWLLSGYLEPLVMFILPGLALTVATQLHWVRYRSEVLGNYRKQPPHTGEAEERSSTGPRRSRSRRSGRRRSGAKPGRYSRHPY